MLTAAEAWAPRVGGARKECQVMKQGGTGQVPRALSGLLQAPGSAWMGRGPRVGSEQKHGGV